MLILTRRINEKILIGDNVSISVLGVRGNQVRLGIEAPKDTKIHREEVYQAIQQQNKESVQSSSQSTQAVADLIAALNVDFIPARGCFGPLSVWLSARSLSRRLRKTLASCRVATSVDLIPDNLETPLNSACVAYVAGFVPREVVFWRARTH